MRIVEEHVKHLSAQIRQRRAALGFTQAHLAEQAGISVELVSRLERGRCRPSVATLVALALALDTTPNALLAFDAPRVPRDARRLESAVSRLPAARRRELIRIAEALARYDKS